MSRHTKPEGDSLDYVELVMAVEAALGQVPLAPDQRERLIREIAERITKGEFGDLPGFDGDDFASLVRKVGPRDPRGQAGLRRSLTNHSSNPDSAGGWEANVCYHAFERRIALSRY